MRLFVAVFPDEAVNTAIDEILAGPAENGAWRPVARERRHVTLRFHADAEPDEVAADLRRRLVERAPTTGTGPPAGPAALVDQQPPVLRCTGAGRFGTALWLGVHATDGWERLLRATGTDPAGHVAHLTVARGRGPVPTALRDHHGPPWRPEAVVLVASGSPHRTVERFPLVGPPGAGETVGPAR